MRLAKSALKMLWLLSLAQVVLSSPAADSSCAFADQKLQHKIATWTINLVLPNSRQTFIWFADPDRHKTPLCFCLLWGNLPFLYPMPAVIYWTIWCHVLWRTQEGTELMPPGYALQRLTYALCCSKCEITINTQLVK